MRRSRLLLPALLHLLLLSAAAGPVHEALADDAPKIRAVSPASATRGQSVDVTVEGSNLAPLDDVSTPRDDVSVTVQGRSTANKVVVRLTIPDSAAAGAVPLVLKTAAGIAKTDRFVVRMRSPVVTKVRPDPLLRGVETDVTITGTHLLFLGLETAVTVEPPVTVRLLPKSTATELRLHLVVPRDTPPGPRSIVIKTTDGQVSAPFTVLLAPPTVVSVAPAVVVRGQNAILSVKGTNLSGATRPALALPDANVIVEAKGPPTVTDWAFAVTTKVDALPGPRLVVVTTPDGYATCTFDVVSPTPPATSSPEPAAGPRGTPLDVKLVAPGFAPPFALRVMPPDRGVEVESGKGPAFRLALRPEALAGLRILVADHPLGTWTAPFRVALRPASIQGVTPSEVAPGAEADLSLEGRDLEGGVVSLVPEEAGVTVTQAGDGRKVHVAVKADAKPGPRALFLRTPDGGAVGFFSVKGAASDAPRASGLVPSQVPRGEATSLRFSGENLKGPAGEAPIVVVTDAAGKPIPAKIVEATPSGVTLEVTPGGGAAFGGAVTVLSTPNGTTAAAFTVVPATPAVTKVTPGAVGRGATTEVVLEGDRLVGPAGEVPIVGLVRPDGGGAIPIEVVAPAAGAPRGRLVLKVTPALATPLRTYILTVATNEGGTAIPLAVTADLPEVASVSPAVVGVPAVVELTVEGERLVERNGKPPRIRITRLGAGAALLPQVLSATPSTVKVRLTTPAGSPAGPHVLVLETDEGTAAGVFEVVAVAPPRIGTLTPAEGARGGAVIVSVRGTGLAGVGKVVFVGTGVTGDVLPGGTDRELAIRVVVAGDAAIGPRALFLHGPGGQSDAGSPTFTVR